MARFFWHYIRREVIASAGGGSLNRSEETMSLDKSLKKSTALARSRNVLSRAERLALLQEDERWTPEAGIYNLPKTKFRRLAPGQTGPKRPEPKS
jgi:small basic protein (TIGR04137 family)